MGHIGGEEKNCNRDYVPKINFTIKRNKYAMFYAFKVVRTEQNGFEILHYDEH